MRLLLANDDGFDAPGLTALEHACRHCPSLQNAEIWVVAPAGEASMIGHRVTTNEPLRFESRGERRFAVHGTPADCTRVALFRLMPEPPDLVLSGINAGGNLGQDIVISGTVAAAREAAYHGLPAIAASHYLKRGLEVNWQTAAHRLAGVIATLLIADHRDGSFFNINLPHLEAGSEEPTVIETQPERGPLPVSFEDSTEGLRYTGSYPHRPQSGSTSDVSVCFGGNISLSRLQIP